MRSNSQSWWIWSTLHDLLGDRKLILQLAAWIPSYACQPLLVSCPCQLIKGLSLSAEKHRVLAGDVMSLMIIISSLITMAPFSASFRRILFAPLHYSFLARRCVVDSYCMPGKSGQCNNVKNWRAENQSGLTPQNWIYPPPPKLGNTLKMCFRSCSKVRIFMFGHMLIWDAHFLLHFCAISSTSFWVGPL